MPHFILTITHGTEVATEHFIFHFEDEIKKETEQNAKFRDVRMLSMFEWCQRKTEESAGFRTKTEHVI